MLTTLHVKHSLSYLGQPLLTVANLPGEGADMSPVEARRLAAALIEAASECEALHAHCRRYGTVCREYPATDAAGMAIDTPLWGDDGGEYRAKRQVFGPLPARLLQTGQSSGSDAAGQSAGTPPGPSAHPRHEACPEGAVCQCNQMPPAHRPDPA